MAIKKTELYSSLWASCNELRGWVDGCEPGQKHHVKASVEELGNRVAESFKAMGLNV